MNSKVVRRLLHDLGRQRVGRVRWQTTDSTHGSLRYPNLVRGLEATYPDQIWCADIPYLRLGARFIFLAVILDAFTRAVRGWQFGRSLSHERAVRALAQALHARTPAIHHSDQGVQYAAKQYVEQLVLHGIEISMADVGQPTQNALAERFIRTLKEEHVDYTEYVDFMDAEGQLRHWLEVEYNQQRIHSALAYTTPAEFEAAFWAETRQSPSCG